MTGVCSHEDTVAQIKVECAAMCTEEQYDNIHITIGECIYVNGQHAVFMFFYKKRDSGTQSDLFYP